MDLYLVKVCLSLSEEQSIRKLLSSYSCLETASLSRSQQQLSLDILLEEERVETLINDLKQKFPHLQDEQLSILPVEIKSTQVDPTLSESCATDRNDRQGKIEIYHQISQSIRLDSTEIALVILATAIAAIGLVQNSQVMIIGAMVIAPLLKPNMALGIPAH